MGANQRLRIRLILRAFTKDDACLKLHCRPANFICLTQQRKKQNKSVIDSLGSSESVQFSQISGIFHLSPVLVGILQFLSLGRYMTKTSWLSWQQWLLACQTHILHFWWVQKTTPLVSVAWSCKLHHHDHPLNFYWPYFWNHALTH